MTKNISIQHVAVFTSLLVLSWLYSTGFFTAEERFPAESSSYIEGATPSDISKWEMF